MPKGSFKTSGFSLAKGKDLTGDDFYDVQTIGNITVAIVCDGVGSAMAGAEAAQELSAI
jgi:serine/threonine protein phosphatase PrpC